MKENFFKYFLRNNIVILGGLMASIFINIVFWFYTLSNIKILTAPIIIRYNVYYGAELMGGISNMLILPSIGAGLIFVNIALSFFVKKKSKLTSNILVYSLVLCQIFLFIAGISLVMINT